MYRGYVVKYSDDTYYCENSENIHVLESSTNELYDTCTLKT